MNVGNQSLPRAEGVGQILLQLASETVWLLARKARCDNRLKMSLMADGGEAAR